MKKKSFLGWLTGSAGVMLLLPWAAVTFLPGDAGMAAALLLFFAVDPIYSVIVGLFAGKNLKEMWSLPIISAVLFLLGTWVLFDAGEVAFVIYAGVYLVAGLAAMFLSWRISAHKQESI